MKRNIQELPQFAGPPLRVIPELDTSDERRGLIVTEAPNSDDLARSTVTVSTLLAGKGALNPGAVPGFACLTHPYLNIETNRPTQNQGGDLVSPVAITGRLADITVQTKGTLDHLALFNGNFMPAEIGMRAEVAAAQAAGEFSSYYPMLYNLTRGQDGVVREVPSDRDTYYICTVSKDIGDLVVRSIIGGTAHNQDGFLQRGLVHDDGTVSYGDGMFVDRLSFEPTKLDQSLGDVDKKFIKAMAELGDTTNPHKQQLAMEFITAMAAKIMNPDLNLKDVRMSERARYLTDRLLPGVLKSKYPASNGVHPYLRGAKLLNELALYEEQYNLSGRGGKALREERARILQSIVSAASYLDLLVASENFDAVALSKRQELGINTNVGNGLRFEAISFDKTDKMISVEATRVLARLATSANQSHYAALKGVLDFINSNPADKFQVRPQGNNTIAPYSSTSVANGPAGETNRPLSYNGIGLAHGVWGYYLAEAIDSLINPKLESSRFAEAGLAMGGVVALFDGITPESVHEAPFGPEPVRCLILSAKQMPWCLQQALHERTTAYGRDLSDVRKVLDGFGIVETLKANRTQEFRVGRITDNGVEMFPRVLTNGDAFAIGIDNSGQPYDNYGHIKGQKPKKRGLADRRPLTRNELRLPSWETDENGNPHIIGVRLADNAVYVGGTEEETGRGPAVTVNVTPHFINVTPVKRGR